MKKTYRGLVAFALSLCTFTGSICGITANAATEFSNFYAPAGISGKYNPLDDIQYKYSSESVFIHLTSATNGAYVQTWGLNGSSWDDGGSNLTYDFATGALTYSKQLYIGDNWVPNLIYESNKKYCGLKFSSGDYYKDSYLKGYWSAD